jgi:CheY-like chemotaxis protein
LLNILKTNAVRGSEMIKQMLSFARGVDGDYAPLQPKHLIKEVIKTLTDTLPKNISIHSSISPDLWSVNGDVTQLHQVLMNLCVNARDAMAHGGSLQIEAENLVIDEHYAQLNAEAKPGRYVCTSVTDTGMGISNQNLSKIFDPFFTTKEQGQGTGLGLSTVAGIVRSHGGFITVYSELNRGSVFKIHLPAIDAATTSAGPSIRPDLPMGNSELIMIVDDESAIREIAKEALLTFNYRVLTASDGAEALALFAQHMNEVSCVITDMMMPIMDGPATIRALRKLAPTMKIIATSGLKTDGKTTEASQLGAPTFLQKPYTAETLLKTLADELKKK